MKCTVLFDLIEVLFEWWCYRVSFIDSRVTQFHRWCPFFLFELDSTVRQQLTIAQD